MVILENTRKVCKVAITFTLQTALSARFIALVLFVSVYIVNDLLPLRIMASESQQLVSYAVFSLLLRDPMTRIVIFSTLFLLFANLPIRGHYALAIIQRTGKRVWMLSQVLYVVLMSILYTTILFVVSLIALVPFNLFENRWGLLLYRLANGHNIGEVQTTGFVSKISLDYFSPDEAIVHILTVMVLLCIFFGLIAIVFNYVRYSLGTVISFVAIFLQLFIYDASGIMLYYISPLTWLTLSEVALSNRSALPAVQYSVILLLVMNSALLIGVYYFGRMRSELDI